MSFYQTVVRAGRTTAFIVLMSLAPASAASVCSPLAPCLNDNGQVSTDSKQPVVTATSVNGVPTGSGFWNPMTFSLGAQTPFSHIQTVYAVGQISPQTSVQFDSFLAANAIKSGALVVFNSPGGDPDAGIRMGRTIRNNSLNTYVGEQPSGPKALLLGIPTIGICASACSFAFLGGNHRTVPNGSLYGVHDVSLTGVRIPKDPYDSGQKEAADVESYITEMGIDPGLLTLLTQYNSNRDEILFMSASQMAELKVTTSFGTSWQLEDVGGVVALVGNNPPSSAVPGSDDAVGLTCAGAPQQATMQISYVSADPHTGIIGGTQVLPPLAFAGLVSGYRLSGFKANTQVAEQPAPVVLTATSGFQSPKLPDPQHVAAVISVTPAVLNLLRSSDILTFAFLGANSSLGQVQFDLSGGRQEIRDFINNCH
jgi:hypothetical protein